MYVVIATKREPFVRGAPVEVFHCENRPAAKRLKYNLQLHKLGPIGCIAGFQGLTKYRRVEIKPIRFEKV